jgi:hypothetical protein
MPACSNLSSTPQPIPSQNLQTQLHQIETEPKTDSKPASKTKLQTDVPLLTETHLSLDFWLKKTSQTGQLLLSRTDITQLNQHLIETLPDMVDIFAAPAFYRDVEIRKLITAVSHPSTNPRYDNKGEPLSAQHWQQLEQKLALSKLAAEVPLQFALVTTRSKVRTFPTNEPVFSSITDHKLDRFQETALFPGEAVQVLHQSADQQWAFVRNYHYSGWVELHHIALTEKSVAQQYVDSDDFILVTGATAMTNVTPELPAASAVQLDMGVKLPRVRQHKPVVNGQNTSFSYVVLLPVRQSNGQLQLVQALISRNQDIAEDYLPLTQANILRQSFKFLGERYGWGHDLNGRDCSGFIGEVFRSFGVMLPRNTGAQAQAGFAVQWTPANAIGSTKQQEQRLALSSALNKAQTGDLIFIPGHVMLVLGHDQGELFVIHDVAGLRYFLADGSFYQSMLNGVSITPLSPLHQDPQHSYQDGIYMLKSFSKELYEHSAH